MVDRVAELKKSYEQNLVIELQNQVLKRKHQLANRKLLDKIRKEFEKLVNDGGAGSPEADRMIRVIRNLDDMIITADKGITDIDKLYKELMDLVKVRYPDSIEAERSDLEMQLRKYGLLETEKEGSLDELLNDAMTDDNFKVIDVEPVEGVDDDYEIGNGNKA